MLSKIKRTQQNIFLWTIASLSIFALVVFSITYFHYTDSHKKQEIKDEKYLKKTYLNVLEKYKRFYTYRLQFIANNHEVKAALKSRDKKQLYFLLQSQWELLQEENPYIQVLHFHLPDGYSFLRMHKPEQKGEDVAAVRPMAAKIHQIKKPLYGFELGSGMLAYRIFLPIFENEKYLGAVEIGSRADQILDDMKYFSGITGTLFVKEDKKRSLKESFHIKIHNYLLQYSTLQQSALLKNLSSKYDLFNSVHIEESGREYDLYSFKLLDFEGHISAKTIFFNDVTDEHLEYIYAIIYFFLFLSIIFGIILVVINSGFKTIFTQLDSTAYQLVEKQNLLQAVMDNSSHMIIATDTQGTITLFNKSAEQLLGYEAAELIHQKTPEIIHKKSEIEECARKLCEELNQTIFSGFDVFIEQAKRGGAKKHEWTYVTKFGKELPVRMYVTTLKRDGKIEGYLSIAEDISQQKEAHEKLVKAKIALDHAQEIAHMGSWTLDFVTNTLHWSDEIYRIFEIEKEQFEPSYEEYLNVIHPNDREMVKEAFHDALVSQKEYTVEHRLKMRDGRIKYVIERGHANYNDKGEAVFVVGTVQDITKRYAIEKEKEHYHDLIDQHIITSSTDLYGRITYASEAFCKISGYTKQELIGVGHNIVRHQDMPQSLYEDLWKTIQADKTWKGEIKNARKDGSYYWVYASISSRYDENDQKIGYTAIRQDITDKKRVEELAVTDRLTGLNNRLKLDEVFAYELEQSKRYGFPLSIIMMDIDKFKSVNDVYGHQVGDQVLQHLATILKNSVRMTDTVGRWGGEEFLIICPKSDQTESLQLAEKLRVVVEKYDFPVVGGKTISCGITAFEQNDTQEIMTERADKALYEAKVQGRNRVMININNTILAASEVSEDGEN